MIGHIQNTPPHPHRFFLPPPFPIRSLRLTPNKQLIPEDFSNYYLHHS